MSRKFVRGKNDKYSLVEKDELGKLCKKYKDEYDAKVDEYKKQVNWNDKMKKHTKKLPREGYLARAVREYYPDLQGLKHDDPILVKAVKLGKRCYDQVVEDENEVTERPSKSKFRQPGGGRKVVAPTVREALYEWFIDVRGSLKARLPRSLFKSQAKFFYDQWRDQQSDDVKQQPELVFSNKWIKHWMQEYNVSLRKPNKRYQIKQEDRKERIYEYIKNVWTVRKFFIDNFSVDPPIINGDQMLLQRNESSTQKTLNIKGYETYVKENYSLSRERITAFTQVSSDPAIVVKPEFVFKGKGTRIKLNPPDGIKYHWAPKGSYRLEQMLATISNLPNRHHIFTMKHYCIYVLDDYSVHIMPEVKEALLKRGYVYIGIGGGITGDIQINDTDIHAPLKRAYQQLEQELMIKQLQSDPKKIPQPSRDDMMRMLVESLQSIDVDVQGRYKSLWLTCALDGSEDYLVSEKLMSMVGEDLKKFRAELMKSRSPKQLKDLLKLITPPKGVCGKNQGTSSVPIDEGDELFDCDGDEIDVSVEVNGERSDDEFSDEGNSGIEKSAEEATGNNGNDSDQRHAPSESPSIIPLAPLCESEELKRDATFLDELGLLLQKEETTVRLTPQVTSIKKQYIIARRNIKKRIQLEKNSNIPVREDEINEDQLDDEAVSNVFENLFGEQS